MKEAYTILALAPLGAVSSKIRQIGRETLDEAVADLSSELSIPVSKNLCPAGYISFRPRAMKDFKPQGLVRAVPYLKDLSDAREFIEDAGRQGTSAEIIAGSIQERWPGLPLDLSAPETGTAPSRQAGRSAVDDILSMVAASGGASGPQASGKGPARWKQQVEELLSHLLEAVFNHEGFREMEAAWRGLELLVRQGEVRQGSGARVVAASVSRESLPKVLEDLSARLAANPPNLVLIDIPFDNATPSLELLEKTAGFAATLLSPAAVWLSPRFFHLDGWDRLKKIPYLSHFLEDAAYAKWRKLRELPEASWLAATINGFLVREPYGENNPPRTPFFRESAPLWIGPVWALGTLTAKSVAAFGWPTRFTDYRNIAVENLAVLSAQDEEASCTEALFSEDRIAQFVEAGITPLASAAGKDLSFIFRETCLSGGSLKFQLFFNRLLAFLFDFREELGGEEDSEILAEKIASGLAEIFRKTGHHVPGDLSVRPSTPEPEKGVSFRIVLTPPETILPQASRLEFDFRW